MGHINSVMEAGGIVDKKKLIAEFCLVHASQRETCNEILNTLEAAGQIKIIENEIWTPKHYDAQKIMEKDAELNDAERGLLEWTDNKAQ